MGARLASQSPCLLLTALPDSPPASLLCVLSPSTGEEEEALRPSADRLGLPAGAAAKPETDSVRARLADGLPAEGPAYVAVLAFQPWYQLREEEEEPKGEEGL